MKSLFGRGLTAAAACWLLAGCIFSSSNDKVAGGEDFPNTIVPTGQIAADDVSSYNQWEQIQEFPQLPDIRAIDSLRIPEPLLKAVSLMKAMMAGMPRDGGPGGPGANPPPPHDSVRVDSSDTALGVVRRITLHDDPNHAQQDTLIFRWDAAYRDTVAGNELLLEARGSLQDKASGPAAETQGYRFLNLDSAGPLDVGVFFSAHTDPDGTRLTETLTAYRHDSTFAASTTRGPAEYASVRLLGQDTVEVTRITDADGDSALWGAGDSGVVQLRYEQLAPPEDSVLQSRKVSLTAAIHDRGDDVRQLAFRDERLLRTGVSTVFQARGIRADSLLHPNDTAYMTFDQAFPAPDSLQDSKAAYFVKLGDEPDDFAAQALVSYQVQRDWRLGTILHTTTLFTPDSLVPLGRGHIRGTFALSSQYADNSAASGQGVFSDDSIAVDLRETKGGTDKTYRVVYGPQGQVRNQETVPNGSPPPGGGPPPPPPGGQGGPTRSRR